MMYAERRAAPRGVVIPAVLAVLLLLTLGLAACGGKKEPDAAPAAPVAATEGAPGTEPGGTSGAPGGLAAAATDGAAAQPDDAGTASGASAAGEAEAGRQAEATPAAPAAKATKESPVRSMLRSAGRDPDAVQPEPDFTLNVPGVVYDGEPFVVEFAAQGAERVTIAWRGKTLAVAPLPEAPGRFTALLSVPLDEKRKSFPLAMTVAWSGGGEETFKADLPVKKRKYPVQRLTVDSKYVTHPPEMQEKIDRDSAEMRAAVNTVSPHRSWTLPMKRPVPGVVTSLYGLRRVFNGEPKNPHKGVDYDAREGDPIEAMEDGVVVLASEHYYGGNTVVVDHGLGVLSAYLHMSAFNVQKGQTVSRGDVIGFIGSTGRVTGPHLHLSLYVLGESVNAATCLDR